jgi:Domain of unknown function (DUF6259)
VPDSKGFSRRRFLSGVASTATTSCLPLSGVAILKCNSTPALAAQNTSVSVSREAVSAPPVIIVNSGYRLLIDSVRGTIASFQSTYGVNRELLIRDHVRLPLFNVEFMNDGGEFKLIASSDAKKITVNKDENEKSQTITIEFKQIGDLPVDGLVTIRCPANETLTYWNLELKNGTKSWIGHVQFPVIEVPFDSPTEGDPSHILSSSLDGSLAGPVEPAVYQRPGWTRHTPLERQWGGTESITPDLWLEDIWSGRQRNVPEIWRYPNYPGQWAATQLMAYYNSAGGLYVACDDAAGLPKFIDRVMEDDGVTLGLAHYPGTRGPGVTKIPYNVVIGTFHGDWYSAAEIYRDWASKQPFCGSKLVDRKDRPKWITDSPVGFAFPMRGQADWDGPAKENPEYTPATNALAYLDKLAKELESPLMPFVYNWEHSGPWVQPEAFPPLGGEAAMREFMTKSKEKGWSPFLYGDSLCWVTWQGNTGYDGMPYFRSHGGEAGVARRPDGTFVEDVWPWRKNYWACVGTEKGRQMILEMTRKMAELGPSVVQQFDQGPGPMACYATDHGHPPVPGPWMTESFKSLLKADAETARSVNPTVAMSCEGAPPEVYLQDFQIWDGRMRTCPLYSFLYHEYCNGHEGFFSNRVDDEALRLSVGRAIVAGYMLNFTLRDKGLIEYDWDQAWTRAIPDQGAILDWAKRSNHFRAGIARDYLVFGRMLRPWTVSNVTGRDFGWGKEPLVQSATWQAADGRIGVVLANCADLGEFPRVELRGQGNKTLALNIDGQQSERNVLLPNVIDVEMQPRSLSLIEVK